jgi:hypothetical protein
MHTYLWSSFVDCGRPVVSNIQIAFLREAGLSRIWRCAKNYQINVYLSSSSSQGRSSICGCARYGMSSINSGRDAVAVELVGQRGFLMPGICGDNNPPFFNLHSTQIASRSSFNHSHITSHHITAAEDGSRHSKYLCQVFLAMVQCNKFCVSFLL